MNEEEFYKVMLNLLMDENKRKLILKGYLDYSDNILFINEKDFENMKKVMKKLHALGIRFYLDDFGTGYSNFERILELPIDMIKFDRSLLLLASKNMESRYMVGSFAEIFKRAHYQVVVEGIESDEDEQICREMKIGYLQGFKYSKPIPMEKLSEFLDKNK